MKHSSELNSMHRETRLSRSEIDRLKARVRISDVIEHSSPVKWDKHKSQPKRGSFWACCPFHAEKTPSFHVSDQRGAYHCFGCARSGDIIRWMREYVGMSYPDALEALKQGCVTIAPRIAPAPQLVERDKGAVTRMARKIWHESRPIAGTLGARYLSSRGLSFPLGGWSDQLRFHPSLEYHALAEYEERGGRKMKVREGPRFPAVVARVLSANGDHNAITRIFLKEDGTGKAPVPSPKMSLGPTRAGAVRLGGIDDVIGVAEGIETALAITEMANWTLPCWAVLSAGNLMAFEPPPGVGFVSIYPDGDLPKERAGVLSAPTGMEAARKLFVRLGCERSVVQNLPPLGTDHLDMLNTVKNDTPGFLEGGAE
jgi:DNA primase